MKKRLLSDLRVALIALCVTVLLVGAITVSAAKQEKYPITEPHKYTLTPDMEEWKNLTGAAQKREACFVDPVELKQMTTEALVETVVTYPLFVDVYAYDSVQTGIRYLASYFGGIDELFAREDAREKLEAFAARVSDRTEETEICYYNANTLIAFLAKMDKVEEAEIVPQKGSYCMNEARISFDFERMEYSVKQPSWSSYFWLGELEWIGGNTFAGIDPRNSEVRYIFEAVGPTQVRFVAEGSGTLTILDYTLQDQDILTLTPLE